VFADLNFSAMKEAQPDELFQAWLDLPDAQRNAMDAELRSIFELSCEKGFRAILDEAAWHLRCDVAVYSTFLENLAALSNHYERAMLTFLDHESYWRGASLFYHADTLTWWRKRKGLPHIEAAVDKSSLQELADSMRTYFHHAEGRGNHCVVEPYRRGEYDYFFAFPEDYSQHASEWVDGTFGRRAHNPAFEVIYVYSQQEGKLDLKFDGSNKAIEPLQSIFATAILKLKKLPADPKDKRVYDLSRLGRKGFGFVFDLKSGIQDVLIRKLRLSSRVKAGDRITLEADPSDNRDAVYDLMAQVGRGVRLDLYNVTLVELVALVLIDPTKPIKSITIRITHPNSCSLKYDEIDLRLRDMLCASGLEPKEPVEPAALRPPDSAASAA
jgi:hypothetical protein